MDMKKSLLITSLSVFSFARYAQEANENAPEITFEKMTIDYGKIEKAPMATESSSSRTREKNH